MTALDEAMIFIKKHINLSYDFDGGLQRKEYWQHPLEVLRELLQNAVVHRDYKNTSDIVIKIFDDHIQFTNPGRIYGNLTIEDLKRDDYVSSIRNKLLAESFYLMGDIEKYGTGFVRIRRWLKKYPGTQYEIRETGDYLVVDLFQTTAKLHGKLPEKSRETSPNELPEGLPDKLPEKSRETSPDELCEKLTGLQNKIMAFMKSDPKVTYDELAKWTSRSRESIRQNIGRLKEAGIVKRIGPDKGGHWKVMRF